MPTLPEVLLWLAFDYPRKTITSAPHVRGRTILSLPGLEYPHAIETAVEEWRKKALQRSKALLTRTGRAIAKKKGKAQRHL